ncbi:hypothetical protein MJD09_19780 [bacterium]|nr:hypothetical protein [bacterium]
MLTKIFTLGLWVQPWEKQPLLINPSIGYFESELFDPADYKFIIPNPAFQRATNRDLFWAAKIIMSFSDEQIRAVVKTAEYAKPENEEYMTRTLIERRDKIGRYWYGKLNPLDRFHIVADSNRRWRLQFDDLAVEAGFSGSGQTDIDIKFLRVALH